MNISRDKILIAIPTHDARVDSAILLGLLACTQYFSRMPVIEAGNAYIQLARNSLAHYFLHRTSCEWLMWIDSDMRFTAHDWTLLWEGNEDVVCAEYSYKYFEMVPPVQWGLGFTRVHRSVFERIAAMKTEDGQDLVRRFYHKGEMMVDFHTQYVSQEGKFCGEDHGFFRWAHAVGASARIETRTRLGHVGSYCFHYPEKISADTLNKLLQDKMADGAQ
jgi:hypothetical protein